MGGGRAGIGGHPGILPHSPTTLHVAARGRQSSPRRCLHVKEAAASSPWQLSPWRDLHPRLHGNGPEPGNGHPARRNPSPEPAPGVFWGRGQTEEGARPAVPPHTPPSSCPPPSLARNRWKDRRTDTPRHSTCITYCPRWVPLVDGVLEVSPQLVKGYNLGEGCVLVRVGAAFYGPSPVIL